MQALCPHGSCLGRMLPTLMLARMRCPEQARRAEAVVVDLVAMGERMCANASLDARMRRTFEPGGEFFALASCAMRTMQVDQAHLGLLAWAPLRVLACGPSNVPVATAESAPPPLPPSARLALDGPLLALLGAIAIGTCFVNSMSLARHRALLAAWAAASLICVAAVLLSSPPRVDPDGFYIRDALSACAFDFSAALPAADLRSRVTSIVAPASSITALYRELRETPVFGVSLREMCGHCGAHTVGLDSHVGMNDHLILGRPARDDRELVLLNLLLPPQAPLEWRERWTTELRRIAAAHADAAFANVQQVSRDLLASTSGGAALHLLSAALATLSLVAAIYASFVRRLRTSVAISLAIVAVVAASLVIGEAVSRLASLPSSPYNAVITPIVLGTGIDSALLLMHAFRTTGGFSHAWPSILASQATTLVSFGIGLILPVKHMRAFFAHCVCTLAVSLLMQVGCFSYLARRAPYTTEKSAAPCCAGSPSRDWRWSIAAICALWLLVLPFMAPLHLEFNLQNQVDAHTPTFRFLEATSSANRSRFVPMYAFVSRLDANWTDVRMRLQSLHAKSSIDWRADFEGSGERNVTAWQQTPVARLMYEGFVDGSTGRNAVFAWMRIDAHGDTGRDHAYALRALARLGTPDVCFASFDLLEGHTLSQVASYLWKLALASSIVCTVVAVVIARQHGLVALGVLGLSYGLTLVVVAALRIKVHMALMAVFIVAPGLMTDFLMHMMYNADARTAVVWSAITSVAVIAPYLASASKGVRDLATVYLTFVVVGLLHALATTFSRSLPYALLRR